MAATSVVCTTNVRSSMSLVVTLSIQVILMIEHRFRMDITIVRYIWPLTRMDTWWLFQSFWRSLPKDALALAIVLCISSSMHPLLDIVLPREVNSRTECSLFPSTMISSSRVLVQLDWYSTSVFLMLIARPNFCNASEKSSTIFCISSATSALSSANSSSLVSI